MAHKTADPEKKRKWTRDKRERRNVFIRVAKSCPCADCGIQYPYWIMQFDHVRGDKAITLGQRSSANRNIGRVMAEIEKCDVVCANCHANRTFLRNRI